MVILCSKVTFGEKFIGLCKIYAISKNVVALILHKQNVIIKIESISQMTAYFNVSYNLIWSNFVRCFEKHMIKEDGMKKKRISLLLAVAVLLGIFAGCLTGCEKKDKEEKEVVTTPLLRIGILSDIHVSENPWGTRQHDRFEKALRFFKEKGVDGVLISGDLQENTDFDTASYNIEQVVDIWFEVFPEGKNDLTGERVEPLFIYGNHDVGLVNEEYWPERLGEYQDAWIKEIKGYQFVGAHYTKEGSEETIKLVSRAEAQSDGKPFFFTQHQPIMDTVFDANEGLLGGGVPMYDVLKKMENCIVFSGHTHIPITNEKSIWQTNSKKAARFTAVNCGTINYGWVKDFGMDINGDADSTQQGMYMVVDGSQVTLERYSFYDMELYYEGDKVSVKPEEAQSLGANWTFDIKDMKKRPYDYDTRQQKAEQPVFADGAEIEVASVGSTYANFLIPPATVGAPEGFTDLVYCYTVEAIDVETNETVATSKAATEHHIDIAASRLQNDVYLGIDGLEAGKTYMINAYAWECYDKASEPLSVTITTPTEDAVE